MNDDRKLLIQKFQFKLINKILIMKIFQFLLVILSFTIINSLSGQVAFNSSNKLEIKIEGTSTLHDWHMTSESGKCSASFTLDDSGKLVSLNSLKFTLLAESLKSGKGGMDKNAYKALDTKSHPDIKAELVKATITSTDGINYTINNTLNVTIAGTTLPVEFVTTAVKTGNTIKVKGEKEIDMTTFGVKPPKFMLGAVKTGKDITLYYEFTLNN